MAKDLVIKTGTYTNKNGEEKGNYVKVGTILQSNDGGEYALLEPTVDLAGCLAMQNMMNHKAGKQVRSNLIASIFDRNKQQQQAPQQPQQSQQAAPPPQDPLSDDIPFSPIRNGLYVI